MSRQHLRQDDLVPVVSPHDDQDIKKEAVCIDSATETIIKAPPPTKEKPCNVQDTCDLKASAGICRICLSGAWTVPSVGPLLAPCDCRGSVEMVHIECLERWLTESGTDTCELCGFTFTVRRIPRHSLLNSFFTWLSTDTDATQMILDLLWFCLMTPLSLFALYMILVSTNVVINGKSDTDRPWIMLSILVTSTLSLVTYYGWVVTAIRQHSSSLWRWWHTNFIVVLVDPYSTIARRRSTESCV
ncbi:E3 ubiquitin-protein ligase MARCHF2-like [Periplaneta americana]|uniref:E3 ubiquitin-protein ligase MARCHF2-like n=1 Tax=Periplaneta americana TaxID=6978 RepID=UPI0037E75EBD